MPNKPKTDWKYSAEGETGKRDRPDQKVSCFTTGGAECWLENHSGKNVNVIVSVKNGTDGDKIKRQTDVLPQKNDEPTMLSTDCKGLNGDLTLAINGKEIPIFKGLDVSFLKRPEELKVGMFIDKPTTIVDVINSLEAKKQAQSKSDSPTVTDIASDLQKNQNNVNHDELLYKIGKPKSEYDGNPDIGSRTNVTQALQKINASKFNSEDCIPKTFPVDSVCVFVADAEGMPPEGHCKVSDLTDAQLINLYVGYNHCFHDENESFEEAHPKFATFYGDHPNLMNTISGIANEVGNAAIFAHKRVAIYSYERLARRYKELFFGLNFQNKQFHILKSKKFPNKVEIIFKAKSYFKAFMGHLKYAFTSKLGYMASTFNIADNAKTIKGLGGKAAGAVKSASLGALPKIMLLVFSLQRH